MSPVRSPPPGWHALARTSTSAQHPLGRSKRAFHSHWAAASGLSLRRWWLPAKLPSRTLFNATNAGCAQQGQGRAGRASVRSPQVLPQGSASHRIEPLPHWPRVHIHRMHSPAAVRSRCSRQPKLGCSVLQVPRPCAACRELRPHAVQSQRAGERHLVLGADLRRLRRTAERRAIASREVAARVPFCLFAIRRHSALFASASCRSVSALCCCCCDPLLAQVAQPSFVRPSGGVCRYRHRQQSGMCGRFFCRLPGHWVSGSEGMGPTDWARDAQYDSVEGNRSEPTLVV
jgi:hypothetical protein